MRRAFEIFLVLVILALGWVFLRPLLYSTSNGDTRFMAARADVANFTTAIMVFKHDCGYYPKSPQLSLIISPLGGVQGTEVLIKKPPAIPEGVWHGPYLDANHQHSKDPWGRPYVYECPGRHNPASFDIYSLGPNGKGGDEAIGNWTTTDR
jgi:general secretion pathway protein G